MNDQNNGFEKLLKQEEVVAILDVTPRIFYRLVNSGRLPALKVGREWRVQPSELRAYLESNTTKPSPRRANRKPTVNLLASTYDSIFADDSPQ